MSTSSVGRAEEDRKPIIEAYLKQRRILLGFTLAIGISCIIWIVAIATDHWFIVSGGNGIYIPESRRYFRKAHSGLWRICRYGLMPVAVSNMSLVRNFTAFSTPSTVDGFRRNIAGEDFVLGNYNTEVKDPIIIDNDFRKALFGSWLLNDTRFKEMRGVYKTLGYKPPKPLNEPAILVNPTNFSEVTHTIGMAVYPMKINGTIIHTVIPEGVRHALFDEWVNFPQILNVLWVFAKDMELSVINFTPSGQRVVLQPPPPPRRGRNANGYDYVPFERCKYYDLFPAGSHEFSSDPAVDDQILEYSRTEASFACISLLVMLMGFVFSVYTFLNPRYMFKRLAGGIHFISACTSLVVIQVLTYSVEYQKENLVISFPRGSTYTYGYGVYIGWFVFITNLFSCLLFLWYSKKKKGSKALTEEMGMADEPINIGR